LVSPLKLQFILIALKQVIFSLMLGPQGNMTCEHHWDNICESIITISWSRWR